MKIKQIGSNQTLLIIGQRDEVLFSYETPVAGFTTKPIPGSEHGGWYRTDKKYSVITSKHINKYLDGVNATFIDQQTIEELIK